MTAQSDPVEPSMIYEEEDCLCVRYGNDFLIASDRGEALIPLHVLRHVAAFSHANVPPGQVLIRYGHDAEPTQIPVADVDSYLAVRTSPR